MAIHKTQALFLRRQDVRETSLTVTAFTKDLGKIRGLLKGVRGSRAAVPWYLEPMTLQEVVLYERKRSSWCLISSCDLVDAFDPIRRDFARTCYASYCLDLTDSMMEPGDRHPEIFPLLLGVLRGLAEGAEPHWLTRLFEAHLLREAGLLPPAADMALSAGGRLSLQQILQTPPASVGRVGLSWEVEQELRQIFLGFFRRALGRDLRSREFLCAVGLEGPNESVPHPRMAEVGHG